MSMDKFLPKTIFQTDVNDELYIYLQCIKQTIFLFRTYILHASKMSIAICSFVPTTSAGTYVALHKKDLIITEDELVDVEGRCRLSSTHFLTPSGAGGWTALAVDFFPWILQSLNLWGIAISYAFCLCWMAIM